MKRPPLRYPRGPARRTRGGIEVLPFQDFVDLLAAGDLVSSSDPEPFLPR
jgi:hypothetical protein